METTPERPSGRAPEAMRPIHFERGYTCHAEGSVLVSFGQTKVICTASINAGVPGFLRGVAALDGIAHGSRGGAWQAEWQDR